MQAALRLTDEGAGEGRRTKPDQKKTNNIKETENEIHFDDEHHGGWLRRPQLAQQRFAGAHCIYAEPKQGPSRIWRTGLRRGTGISRSGQAGTGRQEWRSYYRW